MPVVSGAFVRLAVRYRSSSKTSCPSRCTNMAGIKKADRETRSALTKCSGDPIPSQPSVTANRTLENSPMQSKFESQNVITGFLLRLSNIPKNHTLIDDIGLQTRSLFGSVRPCYTEGALRSFFCFRGSENRSEAICQVKMAKRGFAADKQNVGLHVREC